MNRIVEMPMHTIVPQARDKSIHMPKSSDLVAQFCACRV